MKIHKEKYLRSSGEGPGRLVLPRFQDFHRLQVGELYEYPLHQHVNYEVILVEEGPYTCSLNQVELTVQAHEMLVIKPGDWHQDHLRKGQSHYVLHFTFGGAAVPPAADVVLFAEGIRPAAQIALSASMEEFDLFHLLQKEALRADAYSACIQDAVLEAFFWRMVRCFPPVSLSTGFRQRSVEQEFIDCLYRVFERQVSDITSVDKLAAMMHMSKRTLSMKCQRLLHDSPARLFSRFKVQKAVQLLRHTDRPIKEIAFDLGFENPYHFSRVFKTFHGVAPSALRLSQST